MQIQITDKQLSQLKSAYKTKYVDNGSLYKTKVKKNSVNQNLNKLKILDIYEYLGDLIQKNAKVFTKEGSIGNGEDGMPINIYTIDTKPNKQERPVILIVGGVHGDEKTSIYGICKTVSVLLEHNRWSRFIKDNFVVKIVPCLNIYGFNNNKRNNSNDKDLNRDFINPTQKETKCLTQYIDKHKKNIAIVLDSHNAYNEEFISCKSEMKNFTHYEDIAFKLNLFLNGHYSADNKKSFLWISKSKNDGTLSDFINKNDIIGHTVESPRSLIKNITYPNPVNYEDGCEVTQDLLINLMYIYGKLYLKKELNESVKLTHSMLNEVTAFHGSAYSFDNFDTDHMGKGFGDQYHGWGVYVAQDPHTSLWFMNDAKKKKEGRDLDNNNKWFTEKYGTSITDNIKDVLSQYKCVDGQTLFDKYNQCYEEFYDFPTNCSEALKMLVNYLPHYTNFRLSIDPKENKILTNGAIGEIDKLQKYIRKFRDNRCDYCLERESESQGYHYIVDIPDDNSNNYFYEKHKYTSKEISDIIQNIVQNDNNSYTYLTFNDIIEELTDETLLDGRTLYHLLERCLGTAKDASLALYSIGFLGIHYVSNDEGECYVMFNPKDVHIRWMDSEDDYEGYDYHGSLGGGGLFDMETPNIGNLYGSADDYFDKHNSSKKVERPR